VTGSPPAAPDGEYAPSGAGSLEQLLPWLDRTLTESLQPDLGAPAAWLAALRGVPAGLDGFRRQMERSLWSFRPRSTEWSLSEIFCHLRDVDQDVNLPRLRKILAESNPFLPGEDTDRWAEMRQYHLQDGETAMRSFFAARGELVRVLESLEEADWQRSARHAILGPTRLQELVGIIAAHDRLHVQQVFQLSKDLSQQAF
jgi:hypothetical protein